MATRRERNSQNSILSTTKSPSIRISLKQVDRHSNWPTLESKNRKIHCGKQLLVSSIYTHEFLSRLLSSNFRSAEPIFGAKPILETIFPRRMAFHTAVRTIDSRWKYGDVFHEPTPLRVYQSCATSKSSKRHRPISR